MENENEQRPSVKLSKKVSYVTHHELHEEPSSYETKASLSMSRSTPSLPALVNYALSATASLSKRHVDLTAIGMQRGSSQQPPVREETRRNTPLRRRNSFSNFLSTKYRNGQPQPPHKQPPVEKIQPTASMTSSPEDNGTDSDTKFRKGHRPRSYSDRIPAMAVKVERAPSVAATNKTPIYEYYGFVIYLVSFVALGIYLIWAYVPDEILHSLGITYYPKRYWALAVPIWLVTLVWFVFISFMSINLWNTAPLDSYTCITDEHANVMCLDPRMADMEKPDDWMPELHDIPISVVNAFLYQAHDLVDKDESDKEGLRIRRRGRSKMML